MASPGIAAISVSLEDYSGSGKVPAPALLAAMLRASEKISDLIFSPGRPPQVQVYGQLIPVQVPSLATLTPDDTRRLAADLIGDNKQAIASLREHGSCDISYGLSGVARFRVNIFIQRGSCAIVMRVIPTAIPDFAALRLPAHLADVTKLRDGIVLVTGPAGSGKSSTLAVLLDCMNREKNYHIITIEDPIEFLHNHKCSTIHQRELHSDTPSFAHALRSALRQAPKVILVGEMRDPETIATALTIAETGHLVFSTLHTNDTSQAVSRILDSFPSGNQPQIRQQLSLALLAIVAQQLVPAVSSGELNAPGRYPAVEIMVATHGVRSLIRKGEDHQLYSAISTGRAAGMTTMEQSLTDMVRAGRITRDTAMAHCFRLEDLKRYLQE
jgi:twitching motility protein PilT